MPALSLRRTERDSCSERLDAGLKRSLLRLVIAALILFVAAVSGMALWLTRYDSGQLRARLTEVLSESSGYRIQIAGPLQVQLFPLPGLHASGVTMQSPKRPQPPLATADTVSISIDWVNSFLQRDLILGEASLDSVRVDLARNSEGVANWSPEDSPQSPTDETQPSSSAVPSLLPRRLRVNALIVSLDDQQTGRKILIEVPTGEISHSARGASLDFQLDALIQKEQVKIRGTLAWPSPNDSKLFQFGGDVDLSGGEARLKLNGSSPNLSRVEGLNLRFDTCQCTDCVLICVLNLYFDI